MVNKIFHVSLWATEKCYKCPAVAMTGECLIKMHDHITPPKCIDGSCKLTVIKSKKLYAAYKKTAVVDISKIKPIGGSK